MLAGFSRGFNRDQHIIMKRICSVLDDSLDIGNRQLRICLDNLVLRHAMGEQAQYMVHTEPCPFYNRFTAKNFRIRHDTAHGVHLHS